MRYFMGRSVRLIVLTWSAALCLLARPVAGATTGITVTTTVITAGHSCTDGSGKTSITSGLVDTDSVTYCYTVKNTGNSTLYTLVLTDDMGTPSDTSDDLVVNLSPLSNLDSDTYGLSDDLGAGSTATGQSTLQLSNVVVNVANQFTLNTNSKITAYTSGKVAQTASAQVSVTFTVSTCLTLAPTISKTSVSLSKCEQVSVDWALSGLSRSADSSDVMDVVVVMDESGSIQSSTCDVKDSSGAYACYEAEKNFSKSLLSNLDTSMNLFALGGTAGYVEFSTDANLPKHQRGTVKTLSAFNTAITALTFSGGSTGIGTGISLATQLLVNITNTQTDNQAHNQIIIVLTDGNENQNSKPATRANEARAYGIELYALGITNDVSQSTLTSIAGSVNRTFTAATFSDLTAKLATAITTTITYPCVNNASMTFNLGAEMPAITSVNVTSGTTATITNSGKTISWSMGSIQDQTVDLKYSFQFCNCSSYNGNTIGGNDSVTVHSGITYYDTEGNTPILTPYLAWAVDVNDDMQCVTAAPTPAPVVPTPTPTPVLTPTPTPVPTPSPVPTPTPEPTPTPTPTPVLTTPQKTPAPVTPTDAPVASIPTPAPVPTPTPTPVPTPTPTSSPVPTPQTPAPVTPTDAPTASGACTIAAVLSTSTTCSYSAPVVTATTSTSSSVTFTVLQSVTGGTTVSWFAVDYTSTDGTATCPRSDLIPYNTVIGPYTSACSSGTSTVTVYVHDGTIVAPTDITVPARCNPSNDSGKKCAFTYTLQCCAQTPSPVTPTDAPVAGTPTPPSTTAAPITTHTPSPATAAPVTTGTPTPAPATSTPTSTLPPSPTPTPTPTSTSHETTVPTAPPSSTTPPSPTTSGEHSAPPSLASTEAPASNGGGGEEATEAPMCIDDSICFPNPLSLDMAILHGTATITGRTISDQYKTDLKASLERAWGYDDFTVTSTVRQADMTQARRRRLQDVATARATSAPTTAAPTTAAPTTAATSAFDYASFDYDKCMQDASDDCSTMTYDQLNAGSLCYSADYCSCMSGASSEDDCVIVSKFQRIFYGNDNMTASEQGSQAVQTFVQEANFVLVPAGVGIDLSAISLSAIDFTQTYKSQATNTDDTSASGSDVTLASQSQTDPTANQGVHSPNYWWSILILIILLTIWLCCLAGGWRMHKRRKEAQLAREREEQEDDLMKKTGGVGLHADVNKGSAAGSAGISPNSAGGGGTRKNTLDGGNGNAGADAMPEYDSNGNRRTSSLYVLPVNNNGGGGGGDDEDEGTMQAGENPNTASDKKLHQSRRSSDNMGNYMSGYGLDKDKLTHEPAKKSMHNPLFAKITRSKSQEKKAKKGKGKGGQQQADSAGSPAVPKAKAPLDLGALDYDDDAVDADNDDDGDMSWRNSLSN